MATGRKLEIFCWMASATRLTIKLEILRCHLLLASSNYFQIIAEAENYIVPTILEGHCFKLC